MPVLAEMKSNLKYFDLIGFEHKIFGSETSVSIGSSHSEFNNFTAIKIHHDTVSKIKRNLQEKNFTKNQDPIPSHLNRVAMRLGDLRK